MNIDLPVQTVTNRRAQVGGLVESTRFQWAIMVVIAVNSVTIGLATTEFGRGAAAPVLRTIDSVCLAIYVVEIGLKFYAWRWGFFRSGWNIFDLLIVGVAVVPATDGASVLRALRALRILRLVSAFPQLRHVVAALLRSIPGLLSIAALLGLIFYVSAVMATTLFGRTHPELFGTLGASTLTLFQMMTFDSWFSGIVRPIMETHSWAWAFFIPFVLISALTVLNLFIAVIVDSMQGVRASANEKNGVPTDSAQLQTLVGEIGELRQQVSELTTLIESQHRDRSS